MSICWSEPLLREGIWNTVRPSWGVATVLSWDLCLRLMTGLPGLSKVALSGLEVRGEGELLSRLRRGSELTRSKLLRCIGLSIGSPSRLDRFPRFVDVRLVSLASALSADQRSRRGRRRCRIRMDKRRLGRDPRQRRPRGSRGLGSLNRLGRLGQSIKVVAPGIVPFECRALRVLWFRVRRPLAEVVPDFAVLSEVQFGLVLVGVELTAVELGPLEASIHKGVALPGYLSLGSLRIDLVFGLA